MWARFGRLTVFGVMAVFLTTTGCELRLATTGSEVDTSCLEGDYTLTGVSLSEPLESILGPITVTDPQGSISLSLHSGEWSATADGSISVEGETPYGHLEGEAFLTGTASGDYTLDANRITFTLDEISGSVGFTGTIGTLTIDEEISLDASGLRPLLALLAEAEFNCDSDSLSLTFVDVGLTLHFTRV